jgi:hypothetical protein
MQVGGAARTVSGGAMHDTVTARSILGSSFSFMVTKQSLGGHTLELTSFSSPRPLTGPERRQLNHAGYVATKVTQDDGDLVYYCRRSPDMANALDCFGPERGR